MLSNGQRFCKRSFDIVFSILALIVLWPVIFLAALISMIETKQNGLFFQKRIGKDARTFFVIKIRTMQTDVNNKNTVTASNDSRITKGGAFFRHYKIDELPQLINVFLGDMSFVGPRPDVEGYADKLEGDDRVILSVKPGITGPASLKYKDEEELLSQAENPLKYNDEVLWPDKVKINKEYVENWSFSKDLYYIIQTFR